MEINDFGKWELWADVSRAELDRFRTAWPIFPDHRYTVQLTLPDGQALIDRTVHLTTADGEIVWTARTDNHGRAELWYRPFTEVGEHQERLRLRVEGPEPGSVVSEQKARPFADGITRLVVREDCTRARATDVAFVVDATGSMSDELRFLASELTDVMQRARQELDGTDLRLGAVYYRDHGEAYVTRHQDFAADEKTIAFVKAQRAAGGGDAPEAVTDALTTALDSLSWRADATRLLFLVLDATPHAEKQAELQRLTERAAAAGVRIIPVICSGMDPAGEYLFRSLALATNGTTVFLTDDSGIGGKHLDPVTDERKVEALNDLLVRLLVTHGAVADCAAVTATVPPTPPAPETTPEDIDWRVFPNPTSGPVTVNLPRRRGELYVLDAGGKLLARQTVRQRRFDYDLSGLPAGSYLLRYQDKKQTSNRWVTVVSAR